MFDKTTEKIQEGFKTTVSMPAKQALTIAFIALGIASLALLIAAVKGVK